MGQWSFLKKKLEDLFCPELDVRFYANSYPVSRKGRGSACMVRYWMASHAKIIWDFPRDFPKIGRDCGPYYDGSGITELIQDYVNTPVDTILTTDFVNNRLRYHWKNEDQVVALGLAELLIACDRRIGKRKLLEWSGNIPLPAVHELLKRRFPSSSTNLTPRT